MPDNTAPAPSAAPAVAVTETDPAALVSQLAAAMPTPTAPPPSTPAAAPRAGAAPIDKLGRPFNASKYATNPDGSPRLDKLGRFFSRHLGRKPAASAPAPVASFIPADVPPPPPPQPAGIPPITPAAEPSAPTLNGVVETCIGIFQTVLVFIGEEEGILTETEKSILRPPIERILAKYRIGADILPPELELALAVVAIIIERIKKGRKFATWFAKVRAGVVAFFFRQKGAAFGSAIRREVKPDLVEVLSAEVKAARDEVAAMRAQMKADAEAA